MSSRCSPVVLLAAIPVVLLAATTGLGCGGNFAGNESVAQMDQQRRIFATIEQLSASRPFRHDEVIHSTGCQLEEVRSASTEFFSIYRSKTDLRTPYSEIELRVPTAKASVRDGLVILRLSPEVRISEQGVLDHFGPQPEVRVPTPREPLTSPVFWVYPKNWGKLSFGFSRDGTAVLSVVVIDATVEK